MPGINALYTFRQSGTTACEVLNLEGEVVAWAVDAGWAGLIAGLLNWADCSRSTGAVTSRVSIHAAPS